MRECDWQAKKKHIIRLKYVDRQENDIVCDGACLSIQWRVSVCAYVVNMFGHVNEMFHTVESGQIGKK